MATAQALVTRPAADPRQETIAETQIQRALRRIRFLDLLAGLLGLFVGIVGYGLAVMVMDDKLMVPSLLRQLAFAGFVVALLGYIGLVIVWPMCRPLDRRYVAVQVEQVLPSAKNSIINWVDLREEKLPPAIRGAVAGRAARDLSQADIDRAVSGKHVFWLGGAALAMFIAVIVALCVMGPARFGSLLQRAFAPFMETTIASRTTIEIVLPEGGNATVPVGQSVLFVARVAGREPSPDAPDAMKLLFRYNQAEPVYQEKLLTRGDGPGEWTYRLPAVEVQTGFFYKITGGDFQTPEHQVQVRSSPLLTRFHVSYKHRPYLRKFFKQEDETSADPNLRGWRGTEVTLTAHTNRVVKEGRVVLDGAKELIPSEVVPDSPEAMRFRFVLEKEGHYRIRFVSQEGEHSGDSVSYAITLTPDLPPTVEVTEPEADLVAVPVNSGLPLRGKIKDDYGIADVKLRMKMKNGTPLQARPYRHANFRFEDGAFPTDHDYQDFLALPELKREDGMALKIVEGDIIEYWLEATDNCDYPVGQVGQSKVKRIKVIAPAPDKQAQQDRQQAQDQQQKHDQQTGEKRQQENQDRKNQAEAKPPQPKDAKNEEQKRKDEELKRQKDELQKQVEQKKGEGKPEQKPEPKGERKEPGNQQQPDQQQEKPGEQKPQPRPQEGKNEQGKAGQQPQGGAGEKKPEPKQGGEKGAGEQHPPKNKPTDGKGGQSGDSKAGEQGNKPGDPKGSQHGSGEQPPPGAKGAGEQKGENKPKEKPGDGKGPGQGEKPGQSGEKKAGGAPDGSEKQGQVHPDQQGQEGRPAANDGKPPTGEARGETPGAKGEHKGSPTDKPQGEARGGKPGQDGPMSPTAGGPPGEKKKPPTPGQEKGSGSAHPEKKNDDNAGNAGQPQGVRDPKDPTMDEIAQLAKDLRSSDPEKQVQADRDLRQIAQEAKDAKKREASKEALKQAEVPGGGSPKTKDQAETPGSTATGKTGPKGKEDPTKDPGAGKADGKGGPDKTGKTDGTGKAIPKTGDEQQTGKGTNTDGSQQGQPKGTDPAKGTPGGGPGGGTTGERPDEGRGAAGEEAPPGSPADLANKKRAAELQLEELMKKITPEMLKERNWTEDDLKRWHQAMKDLIKRDYQRELEKFAPPQRGPASVPGGLRRVDGTTAPGQDVKNLGKTAAPPDIRNAYQEWSQEMAKELARPKKK
jgi:hypothetical protein